MADTSTNSDSVRSAIIWASEVLPVPAGPNRMTELRESLSMAVRSQLPSPTAACCPTNSSRLRGRMRTARGATFRRSSFSISVKRVSMEPYVSTDS